MDPGSPFAMVCVPPGCVMAAMSHSVSNKVLYQKKKKKKKKKGLCTNTNLRLILFNNFWTKLLLSIVF